MISFLRFISNCQFLMLFIFKLLLVFSFSFKVIELVFIFKLMLIDSILFDILLLFKADFFFTKVNFFIFEFDLSYFSS
jgi:hypothetical protein